MGKTKRRREEMRGEEVEEGRGKEKKKPKKGEDNGSKENSTRMGDME